MSTNATVTLNPQILGQAENAHLAILTRALAGTGVDKNQWVALNLAIATGESDPEVLVARVNGALKIGEESTSAAVAELVAAGLLENLPGENGRLGVAAAGRELAAGVRAATGQIVARAYGEAEPEDLQAAARALTAITARLNTELAAV